MIIDSHCHLSDARLKDRQEEIISSLSANGIESVFEVGWDLQSSKDALELSRKYSQVWAAVGTHPHDAKSYDDESESFYKRAAQDKKVIAIGEIGLDYYYDLSPRDVQRRVFREQLELAHALSLPVALHVRDAYGDCLDILKSSRHLLAHGVLLHCYSGSAEMVREFSALDCYYAFGGAITFKNARHNLEALAAVPRDRLLLETDSPYMTPVPYRGKTNFPKYVGLVADKMAQVLSLPREEVERITAENTKRLFFKMK